MRFYSYVIPRDYGFAPNPYFGYCTLATCKPQIRKYAQIGDWVAAFGSASTKYKEKLVMLMRVDEILTFDEYWGDKRFIRKIPVFNRSIDNMYGDNIYHNSNGKWIQEFSHHSYSDGSINYANLNTDTGTNRVLIATNFYYFGCNAINLPEEFTDLIFNKRNYKINNNTELINAFIQYMKNSFLPGRQGDPYSRKRGGFAHYKGAQE